VVQSRKC